MPAYSLGLGLGLGLGTSTGGGAVIIDPTRLMIASTRFAPPTRMTVSGATQLSRLSNVSAVTADRVSRNHRFVGVWHTLDAAGSNGSNVALTPLPENDIGNDGTIDFQTLQVGSSFYPLKVGGNTSWAAVDGSVWITDALTGLDIAPRTSIKIRTSDTIPLNGKRPGGLDIQQQNGEGVEMTATPQMSKATAGTVGTTNTGSSGNNGNGVALQNNGLVFSPVMMISEGWDGEPVFTYFGDSLAQPAVASGRWAKLVSGVMGWIGLGLDSIAGGAKRIAACNMAVTGSKPSAMSSRAPGAFLRRGQMFDAIRAINGGRDAHTHIFTEHLINDANAVIPGTTLQTKMQTYLDFLHSEFPYSTIVQAGTLTSAYSPDQLSTLANQYPRTADSTWPPTIGSASIGSRFFVNNWFKTLPSPISVFTDPAPFVDDATDPSKYLVRTYRGQLTQAANIGDSFIWVDTAPLSGELLVPEPGTANAETVPAGSGPDTLALLYADVVTGTGPYRVTLYPSLLTKAHSVGAVIGASPSPDFVHLSPLVHIEASQCVVNDKLAGKYVVGPQPPAAPQVPRNTALPTLTGSTALGGTLTVSNGTWLGSPTGYASQIYRDGAAISGATGSTYVVQAADQGHTLTVTVIATNGIGDSVPYTSAGAAIPGVGGGALLLESGSKILLETTGNLIQE